MTTVAIDHRTGKPYIDDFTGKPIECMEDHTGDCKGVIDFQASLSGTGVAMIRCDFHQNKRLDLQERINRDYGSPDSDIPPSWFKPSWGGANEYGERWDDD